MEHQDWNSLTIRSKRAADEAKAKTTKHMDPDAAHARKVADTEYAKPKKLAPESRAELVKKRVELGKNQQEFNQLCNFPPNTIRDIEAGRLTPSTGQLNVLNRVLKTGLKLV